MRALPRLRPLEILRLPDQDGAETFLLRDPEGYSDDELVMSEAALFVAAHADGVHTLDQLHENFAARYGKPLPAGQAQRVFDRLEAAFMIESPAFLKERARAHQAFLKAEVRPAAHAGQSYPEEPEAARAATHRFLAEAADREEPGERPPGRLRGLIAPHIDLRVGGSATALPYRVLAEAPQVDTVIVLGTAHGCGHPAWIVTDKPYATPLGVVPVAEATCRRLARAAGTSADDVFFHRREHSIEFQALFLAALREEGRPLTLVPVLCGSLRGAATPPLEDPFLNELQAVLTELGPKAVVLAGADLAHVGPRFGDPEPLSELQLKFLEKKDRATLQSAVLADATLFFTSVMEAEDPRRICGLAPIFGLLSSMPSARGKVLCYEQATDATGTVSYASAALWGE